MSEIKLEIRPKTILGFILISISVIVILHGIFRALLGIEEIISLIGVELTELQAFIETLGWFFGLLIQILGGFFLGIIGTRITKK